jgi:hypothetical protein
LFDVFNATHPDLIIFSTRPRILTISYMYVKLKVDVEMLMKKLRFDGKCSELLAKALAAGSLSAPRPPQRDQVHRSSYQALHHTSPAVFHSAIPYPHMYFVCLTRTHKMIVKQGKTFTAAPRHYLFGYTLTDCNLEGRTGTK